MSLPWTEPLTLREPGPRTIPEPPRKGEPSGPPCRICTGKVTDTYWEDEHWTLHPPHDGSLPGAVWVASKVHAGSFSDLPSEVASTFGSMAARVESAILERGDVGRVHLYRWGDGGAHFHVWFMPRPLGLLEASGHLLPLWEEVLPRVPDEQLESAAREVADRMRASAIMVKPTTRSANEESPAMSANGSLQRRLSTADAVVIGLSAMVGAGVFVVWGPAATAAGRLIWVALAVAAAVAFCNAVASAQLARRYPNSGGTYVYGREVLGPWWGFLAGWSFVVGKTASCAAMAMAVAAYAFPSGVWQRVVAVAVVAALTFANVLGVTKTATVARVLLVVAVAALVVVLAVTAPTALPSVAGGLGELPSVGALGVLQGAGLIFFAFAGYARIATLGEEVRQPQVIGRAILSAFAIALVLYAAVLLALSGTLGGGLVGASTPLRNAVDAVGASWAAVVVQVGAVAAAAGALLALLAGVARTSLAMAREGDLPRGLSAVDPARSVPRVAQLLIGAAVCVMVLVADLRGAIGFSSCGVLLYYFVANVSAWRQPRSEREWPRALNLFGALGCLVLVASLPAASVVGGLVMIGLGVLGRLVAQRVVR